MTEYLPEFAEYLKQRGKSENTVQAYVRDLSAYLAYTAAEAGESEEYGEAQSLARYVRYLESSGRTPATISRFLCSMKCFIQFLGGQVPPEFLKCMERQVQGPPPGVPDVLTPQEILLFLQAPDCSNPKGRRDRALLQVFYATGMRVSDLAALNFGDYDPNEEVLAYRNRDIVRVIPLPIQAVDALNEYCADHPELSGDAPLFANRKGERMTRQGIWKIVKAYCRQLGLNKEVTPDTFRHSLAQHMLENGVLHSQVRQMLGNSCILHQKPQSAQAKA